MGTCEVKKCNKKLFHDVDDEYKIEKKLKDHGKSVNKNQLKIIVLQMEKSICKIYCNDGSYGTGFFCRILFPDYNCYKNPLNVLITNNHILKQEDINPGKKIEISINDESTFLNIYIDGKRLAYTFEKPDDVTFIEIKSDDKIPSDSYIELDDNIFDQNKMESYFQNTVYLLHYPNGNNVEYSTGKIKSIAIDNYEIEHFCESQEGSSGGPIINLANFKVIGVHKGSKDNKNFNVGTFLKGPIEKFYKKYKEKLRPELNYFPKINVYQMQVIINQMKNSVCKIFDKNLSGTGFLCYIPFPKIINKFPILITNYHILGEKYISKGSKINFSFGDSNYINTIIIDKNRKVFSNKALDFTIIGIKPSDKIKSEYFLQFDENK